MNTVPWPGAARNVTVPPWSSMILCVMASPSPVPPGLVVKNGLKTSGVSSGLIPLPVSATSTHQPVARRAGRALPVRRPRPGAP